MNTDDLIDICTAAVPESGGWDRVVGEKYGANSLVSDVRSVNRVLYCVTPTLEVQRYFRENAFDLLISHHPMASEVPTLTFHTALDCAEGGLNDRWRDALGLRNARHFDGNLGWAGEIDPVPYAELVARCAAFAGGLDGETYWKPGKSDLVHSVVLCTGLGGMVTSEAGESGAEVYVVGQNLQASKDMGFRGVIEVGHTLTEWIGVDLFRSLLNPHDVVVEQAPIAIDRYGSEVYAGTKRRKS